MSVTGLVGQGPVRVGIPIADLCAGMLLAQGVLIALLDREISGEGQWVQTSLLETQIQMLDFQAARYLMTGEVPGQAGNDHPTMIPTGVFPTRDGHINIASAGQALYERLCRAIGAPYLIDNLDYRTDVLRSKNRVKLNAEIAEIMRTRDSADWITLLSEAGCPVGPIYSIDQVFADPQVQHVDMTATVRHPKLGDIRIVGQGLKLDRTPAEVRDAAPELGEHTDAILGELGYHEAAIEALRKNSDI
jgi:formyl-CoA transferase